MRYRRDVALPKVWLVPGGRAWSYDFTAHALVQHLSDRFEIRVAYADTIDELDHWSADLVVDFWWKGKLERRFGQQTMKQVSSHRWSQGRYHRLTTKLMARKHLSNAGWIAVPSLRLEQELNRQRGHTKLPPVSVCPKGFHPDLMGDYGARRGPLAIGWAGNATAVDKNVPLLLQADPSMRVADRCLTQGEMGDFYNSIDVITCASVAEGDPRPLIEAMACGCFPVVVDVGIVPELVRDGDNGLIVQRTPEAFAAAFQWCRDNIDYVREAGRRNARELAATRTWAVTSRSWGDAFSSAIERAGVFRHAS
jgi:glycosyltransferase involved in cell wall biosynthesis